jgi:nicotinate-nucleotide adenylyltransferase
LPCAELPAQADVRLLRLPDMPESATEVRERVSAREGIDHLVPTGVARYIDLHHLYQPA